LIATLNFQYIWCQ